MTAKLMALGIVFFLVEPCAAEQVDLVEERIRLMEKVGANAEAIGDALKADKTEEAATLANAIVVHAKQLPALFPPGSTSAASRARPEIWSAPEEFAALFAEMQTRAATLAAEIRSGDQARPALFAMFKNCKACHRKFRLPED